MDRLFCPWRYAYVTNPEPSGGECILCELAEGDPSGDEEALIVHRDRHTFIVLNRYPYTSGHIMVVPYLHEARLAKLPEACLGEMARLTARAETVLGEIYHPDGLNVGLNLGRFAGAGITSHLHTHIVPRWGGDTSFMTVTGETRVMPEDLGETWGRLHGRF